MTQVSKITPEVDTRSLLGPTCRSLSRTYAGAMNNSVTSTLIPARMPTVDAWASMVRGWAAPGLGAGAAFLAFEMVVGSVTTAAWAFPQSIAQTIGVAAPTSALDAPALLLGMTIHMAFSVGLGVLFIALAQRLGLRSTGRLLVAGVLFMWVESAVSIWAVLHTLFPSTLYILFSAMPFWASIVGRTSFGLVLAWVVSIRRSQIDATLTRDGGARQRGRRCVSP